MSILSQSPDLTKIIKKAVDRIGENHSLARDNKGVTMMATEIEKDRKEFRSTKVIEESLKAAADEMAEKMVLENTIDGMVKDVIQEQTQEYPKNWEGDYDYESLGPVGFPIQIVKDVFKRLPTRFQDTIKDISRGGAVEEVVIEMKNMCKGAGGTWNPCGERTNNSDMDCWCTDKDGNKITPWIDKYQSLFMKKLQAILDKIPTDKIGNMLSLQNKEEEIALSESTTGTIKKIVNKKLKTKLKEAKKTHPGYDTYEKAVKVSKTENDKAMKASAKKFKEYEDFNGNTKPEFPHQEDSKTDPDNIGYQYYRNNDDDQEFIDDFAHPGLIDFDINNLNMEKLTDYLEGSSTTGNAQEDEDGELLGNVGYKSDLGGKMKKSAERRKEKIAANKASMSNLRGYTPDVQKVKQVKEEVTVDLENMKKLWNYKKITQ